MIKKIILTISLIAAITLLIVFQSARTYFATGASALLAVLLFLLVLALGAVVLFIMFFLWQTGSLTTAKIPKKALLAIGGGIVVFALIVILLATGGFSRGEGFPLALWLIVVSGVLGFRAFTEIKKPGAPAVTFDMGCVALGFLTLLIIIFEVFCPGWWGNVWGAATGKLLLIGFVVGALLWYILPGTGKITVQSGKILSAIIMIVSLVMLVGIATQKDFAQGIQGIQEKGALRWSLTETKDFLWKSEPPPPPKPPYEIVAQGEFIGKGTGGEEAIVETRWFAPRLIRKGDMITYRASWVEVFTGKEWKQFNGPEITRDAKSDIGQLTFKGPKGEQIYIEVWRPSGSMASKGCY